MAASFFILGDSLRDAVNVCLRQLDDFQLAIAITRAYEGDDGPVLQYVLESHVVPLAFARGYRWLASWAFWMMNRRDLAVRVLIVRDACDIRLGCVLTCREIDSICAPGSQLA